MGRSQWFKRPQMPAKRGWTGWRSPRRRNVPQALADAGSSVPARAAGSWKFSGCSSDRRLTWTWIACKIVAAMLLVGCAPMELAAPALDHPSSRLRFSICLSGPAEIPTSASCCLLVSFPGGDASEDHFFIVSNLRIFYKFLSRALLVLVF